MPTPPPSPAAAELAALADGIVPADERDAGAAAVDAGPRLADRMERGPFSGLYADGLRATRDLAELTFGRSICELTPAEIHELLTLVRDRAPAFFKQLRLDVCAMYLSDPGVWQRIGFPGPSIERGGYEDFDRDPDVGLRGPMVPTNDTG